MARGKMARVLGEGRRNGATPDDIPDGFVSWDEHYKAWHVWNSRHRDATSAEEVERGGGFNYRQLADLLGHNPVSWELQEFKRYEEFQLSDRDAPPDLTRFEVVEPPKQESHIRDGISEKPACQIDDNAPDGMFFFDYAQGPHCEKCMAKMQVWLNLWIEMGKEPIDG